jgi:hypothetical protein
LEACSVGHVRVDILIEKYGDEIQAVAREMKPCEYCENQHYETFVVRELLNHAFINLGESGKLSSQLSTEQ